MKCIKKYIPLLLLIGILNVTNSSTLNSEPEDEFFSHSGKDKDKSVSDTLQILIDSLECVQNYISSINTEIENLRIQKEKLSNYLSDLKTGHEKLLYVITSLQSELNINKLDTISRNKLDTLKNMIIEARNHIPDITNIVKRNDKQISVLIHKKELYDTLHISIIDELKNYTSTMTEGKSIYYKGVYYNLFVADMETHEVKLHLFNEKNGKNYHTLRAVQKSLKRGDKDVLMITNAGMFTQSFEPEGLYIEKSSIKYEIDTAGRKGYLNFYRNPNGVFYIDSNDIPRIDTTEQVYRLLKDSLFYAKIATQSGPMLIINGKMHPDFRYGSNSRKIRSGVGIISDKKVLFAITLNESNFYDFTTFFRDLFNCENALFLDGVISRMYIKNINPDIEDILYGPIISVTGKQKK